MSEKPKTAGLFSVAMPVVSLATGLAVAFVPYTGVLADILLFAPLPVLVYLHWKGRRGAWSIAGIVVAALPYVAVVESLVSGRPRIHIPL